MDIRPYAPADEAACFGILASNIPAAFAENARDQFAAYLATAKAFFVAEHDGAVIGCGGYEASGNSARLLWGMVHQDWQRKGLGRFLLFYRMREITKTAGVEMVSANVPPSSAGFFAAQGFRELGSADGMVVMVKRLVVCA